MGRWQKGRWMTRLMNRQGNGMMRLLVQSKITSREFLTRGGERKTDARREPKRLRATEKPTEQETDGREKQRWDAERNRERKKNRTRRRRFHRTDFGVLRYWRVLGADRSSSISTSINQCWMSSLLWERGHLVYYLWPLSKHARHTVTKNPFTSWCMWRNSLWWQQFQEGNYPTQPKEDTAGLSRRDTSWLTARLNMQQHRK